MSYKEEYNHHGWRVFKTKNNKYALEYERNIISEDGALIQITEDVFNDARDPNCNLIELFNKHDLEKSEVLLKVGKPIKLDNIIKKNTQNKFHGNGYIVRKKDEKYYLRYRLAQHGDGIREFEITEQVYLYDRNKGLTMIDILKKYDLYKLDIPENNVK